MSATVAAGIVYTSASGWDTIAEADADSNFEPFAASAEFEDPFRALVRPFGQIDVALAVDLGLLFFDLTLVDVRFVKFRDFGLLDFELPTLTDEGDLAYLGPDWILGAGVSGSLKVELGGALASFLDFIGIDTVFVDPSRVVSQEQTSALFQEFEQLEVSP